MNALGVVENPERFDAFCCDQGILVHRSPDFLVLERLVEAFDAADRLRMMTLGSEMHKATAGNIFPETLGSHRWTIVRQELDLLR